MDLEEAITACIRLVKARAKAGRVALKVDSPGNLPRLRADERRLKQALLNLVTNAVKFTPEGGWIKVSITWRQGSNLKIVVEDDGIGMNEAEIAIALEEFGQVDSGLDRRKEGTGLGLPLTKGLVELHGGKLAVESQKGVGTKITILLPEERILLTPSPEKQGTLTP